MITPSKTSFSLPLRVAAAGLLLGAITSPRASRFLLPAGISAFESATVVALALEAAVARVTPPVAPAKADVPVAEERGLVRVEIREGRALVFSFSFTAVARVVRVTRRVWHTYEDGQRRTPGIRWEAYGDVGRHWDVAV
jgi:hypothetical protein